MTEKEAWNTLQHEMGRMGRRALTVWAVWTAIYVVLAITMGVSAWAYTGWLGVFLWALYRYVQRPVNEAMAAWDAAMTAEWDVPPPLMQGTLTLYDDSHGYKVGDKVPMDEHLYEVVDVKGSQIEVREVPRG